MDYKKKYLKYKEKYLKLKHQLGGDKLCDDESNALGEKLAEHKQHIKRYVNACKHEKLPIDAEELKEFEAALNALRTLNDADKNKIMEITQKCWYDKQGNTVGTKMNNKCDLNAVGVSNTVAATTVDYCGKESNDFMTRNDANKTHIKRYVNACKYDKLPTKGEELTEFEDALKALKSLDNKEKDLIMKITKQCWFDTQGNKATEMDTKCKL